ncbi:MAG: TonB-dependent receptor [Gammaproteobacteria bacterium]|nr:TonB-dependent receptor [Pseudomonadales bacterium]MCP5345389.1 TonB-dependent receptor [Pseudomonadales bacterium]
MLNSRERIGVRRKLLFSGIVLALSQSNLLIAQQDPDIEEVVVTGSFIRNSSFNGASPVETLTAESISDAGTARIGDYMRDLTFTANTDTVSNVLGGPGGGQDGTSTGFNLRGLGDSSTLTLLDGSRVVDQSEVGALLPSIALSRMEVVLDGGAALYGADAVAGVVNIIPIKDYNGIKANAFYQRDDGGDTEQMRSSVLYGGSWENLNWVVAAEISKSTPLMRHERFRYLAADNDEFQDGPAGTWRTTTSGASLVDPSCETFNQGNEVKGRLGFAPSGRFTPISSTQDRCVFNYGQWIQYVRPQQEQALWANLTWQTTDWLRTDLQFGYNHRLSTFITEPMSPVSSAWKPYMVMPASHPANPWGEDVYPLALRLVSGHGQGPGTTPSYVNGVGSAEDDSDFITDRTKLSFNYNMGNTSWSGETSFTYQTRRWNYQTYEPQYSHWVAAMNGKGGPNGNEYYNPLLSSDPRSPYYVAGVTSNSQEVLDWMFTNTDQELNRDRLLTFDSYVTGEVLDLPAGPLQMAFGVHARKFIDTSQPRYIDRIGNNWTTTLGAPGRGTPPKTYDTQYVKSTFLELEIPILQNLSAQVAGRYEKFEEIGIPTATPKYALRYQPLESLAIRASYGEGFLAPEPSQIGALRLTNCGTERDGADPITGTTLLGVESCNSPNPDLDVEESKIINVGFTYEPIDDLTFSVDYQVIKYDGRIVSPDSIDIVLDDFARMLKATGYTVDNYDPTPGTPSRIAANAWLDAHPNPLVTRNADRNATLFIEVPENVESVSVKAWDYAASYRWTMNDLGQFGASIRASYIHEYIFDTLDGSFVAVGYQNGQTAKAPPLPAWKTNIGFDWLIGSHRTHATVRYTSDIKFNDNAPITTPRAGLPETLNIIRPTTVEGGYQLDLNYSYDIGSVFGFGQDVTLGVNVNNVFDWMPDALPIPGGLETRLYDPFGRTLSLSLDFAL